MNRPNVLPTEARFTQNALKLAISLDVQELQRANTFTDDDLGDEVGCCGQTISNARNMRNETTLFILWKIVRRFGGGALARTGAVAGIRFVPIDAKCDTDRRCGSAVSRLAYAISCALENDDEISDEELDAEVGPALEAAGPKIDALRERYRLRQIVKQIKAEQAA